MKFMNYSKVILWMVLIVCSITTVKASDPAITEYTEPVFCSDMTGLGDEDDTPNIILKIEGTSNNANWTINIIDITSSSYQPVVSTRGVLPFCSNGECYANVELSTQGLQDGHQYKIILYDKNGNAVGSKTFTYKTPFYALAIEHGFHTSNASCGNGSATITMDPNFERSGKPPYSYLWSTGATGTSINNLTPGSYWLNVTDANGCTLQRNFVITQTPPLSVTAITGIKPCGLGFINLNISGGTSPYIVNWSGGTTGISRINLGNGIYSATITDAKGCSTTISATISGVPEPFVITSIVTHPTLAGCGQDGTIHWVITGGGGRTATTPTPSYQTGLGAGNYNCTLTDANGCTTTASVTLNDPGVLGTELHLYKSDCAPNKCSVDTKVWGGTPPYQFTWSNGATTEDLVNLDCSQVYNLTITDANGCTAIGIADFNNGNDPPLSINANVKKYVNCVGNCSAVVFPTGGTPPYTYSWAQNGATTKQISGINCNDPYTVTVTDHYGCSVTVTTDNSPALAPYLLVEGVKNCDGTCSYKVIPIGLNTNGTYTTSWPKTIYGYFDGPCSGITVTATDADGCSYTGIGGIGGTFKKAIRDPQLDGSISIIASTVINCQYLVQVIGSGGTPGYTYLWSDGATSSSRQLGAGTYYVTITDSKGCSVVKTIRITCGVGDGGENPNDPPIGMVRAYPNPTQTGLFTLDVPVSEASTIGIQVVNSSSISVFNQNMGTQTNAVGSYPINISTEPAGSYTAVVTITSNSTGAVTVQSVNLTKY